MNKITKVILALIALAAVLALVHLAIKAPAVAPQEVPQISENVYVNDAYGLTFTTPDGLYLKERDAGTVERPQLSISLVEDTQDNRDLLDGKVAEPREGPPAIAIDVYQNPDNLSTSEWVQQDTNWTVANSSSTSASVAGFDGVSFTWSGLYEGRTVVVTRGGFAYVFNVTWSGPEDRLIADFDSILNSVTLR